jgi:hypothetical protein
MATIVATNGNSRPRFGHSARKDGFSYSIAQEFRIGRVANRNGALLRWASEQAGDPA